MGSLILISTTIYIYIYIYISSYIYIYVIAWIISVKHWFHAVFIQQSSGKKKIGEIEKIGKIKSKELFR